MVAFPLLVVVYSPGEEGVAEYSKLYWLLNATQKKDIVSKFIGRNGNWGQVSWVS